MRRCADLVGLLPRLPMNERRSDLSSSRCAMFVDDVRTWRLLRRPVRRRERLCPHCLVLLCAHVLSCYVVCICAPSVLSFTRPAPPPIPLMSRLMFLLIFMPPCHACLLRGAACLCVLLRLSTPPAPPPPDPTLRVRECSRTSRQRVECDGGAYASLVHALPHPEHFTRRWLSCIESEYVSSLSYVSHKIAVKRA